VLAFAAITAGGTTANPCGPAGCNTDQTTVTLTPVPTAVPTPEPSADLHGKFLYWEPVSDSRGYAHISITNRSDVPGTAYCYVEVSDSFGDSGWDSLTGEEIAPHYTSRGKVPIDVGQGSWLIDHGEVRDC
jgi:hypothetical protein